MEINFKGRTVSIIEKHKGKKIHVYKRCKGNFFHRSCMDGILSKQK